MGAVKAIDMADRWNSRDGNKKIIILANDDSRETLNAVKEGKLAIVGPYPPFLSGVAERVLLKHIAGEELPKSINAPDLPSVTKGKMNLFGISTVTPDEWMQYAYGPEM